MNCLFVYNPYSGKGKILKKEKYIVEKLKTKFDKVEVVQTKYPKHAKEIVEEKCLSFDTLVVGGGDGTLSEVINALGEKDNAPTIGYIPAGTVNDVAHSLNIPRNVKKAVGVILKGKLFRHDIFKVNDKYGIYVCATGLGTESSYDTKQKSKKFFGKLAYFFNGAKKIFKNRPMQVKIIYGNTCVEKNCALLLIINSKHVAGFIVNKKAVLDDGYVDVVLVEAPKNKGFSFVSLLTVARLFLFGLNYNKKRKHITYLKLKDFSVEIKNDSKINLDGEKALEGSFSFKSIDKGVKIYIP